MSFEPNKWNTYYIFTDNLGPPYINVYYNNVYYDISDVFSN